MTRPLVLNSVLDAETIRRLNRQFDQVCELMARLAGSNVPGSDFFQALVTRTLGAIDGTAGAIWLKSPQGMLQLQHQTNFGQVGLDDRANGRAAHNELLKHVFESKKLTPVDADTTLSGSNGTTAGNLTSHPVVLAPILSEQGDIYGIFEVWLDSNADPKLRNPHIHFINTMSGYASNYLRNTTALRNTVQEQVFTQLETFSKQIHSTLNCTQVAFLIANEGRRLIGCDRISVGIRHGKHTTIEAVSGSDIVEKSSVQVKMMRDLFDAVFAWNERLIYRGSRDATLPPDVLAALDAYLAQSNSKLLVLQPLRDEREAVKEKEREEKPGPARSALLLESFEPAEQIDPMMQRFDIIAGHSASALYNAAEMKRIPFALLWKPIMSLQKRAGGKGRFYAKVGFAAVTIFLLAMFFIPYPLKLDAKGQLLPEERHYIYPTSQGRVTMFKVLPGSIVKPHQPIAVLKDRELAQKIEDKIADRSKSQTAAEQAHGQANDASLPENKRKEKRDEYAKEKSNLESIERQIANILKEYNANLDDPGEFTVTAPEFARARNAEGPAIWKVVSADFQEQLTNRWVKPTEPLLRVGNTGGAWQIEMKIPQKHISQLLRAYKSSDPNEYLEVDVLVTSAPTSTFTGRLYRRDISGEAVQNKDDHNESELIVYAYVRVNAADMPEDDHIPEKLLVTGVEVHTKIRCGNHSMGYSLFHGAWEFFYEHVIFFF